MNEEIKEILYLEKYIDKYKSDEKSIINGNRLTTPAMLDYLETKALLDYITNLQAVALEQKQRIDKAIEYIEHYAIEEENYSRIYSIEERELLQILKGSDKK